MKILTAPAPFSKPKNVAPTQLLRDMIDEGFKHSAQDLHDVLTLLEQQLGMDRTMVSEWGTATEEEIRDTLADRALDDAESQTITEFEA